MLIEKKSKLTKSQLSEAIGADQGDLDGIVTFHPSPDLQQMFKNQQTRLISQAGMSDDGEGPIGAARLVEDIKKLFRKKT
jgi:hypothetical protein